MIDKHLSIPTTDRDGDAKIGNQTRITVFFTDADTAFNFN